MLARIYTRERLWGFGLLALGVGTLIPLCLVLVGGGAPGMLGAGVFIMLGSLGIRFLLVKIPHASPRAREESEV